MKIALLRKNLPLLGLLVGMTEAMATKTDLLSHLMVEFGIPSRQ